MALLHNCHNTLANTRRMYKMLKVIKNLKVTSIDWPLLW